MRECGRPRQGRFASQHSPRIASISFRLRNLGQTSWLAEATALDGTAPPCPSVTGDYDGFTVAAVIHPEAEEGCRG